MRLLNLVLVAAFLSLGCPEAVGSPPPPADTSYKLAQDSDSTAALVATWSQVDPPADIWRWRLVQAQETGQTTSSEVSVVISRRDTAYVETFCVRGVAQRGGEEAVGEEGCASAEVPATPLDEPGTPAPEVQIDTVMAMAPESDSAWVFARWSPGEGVYWYRTYVEDESGDILAWRNDNNWTERNPWASTGFRVPRRAQSYEATLVLQAFEESGNYHDWPVPQEVVEETRWTWTVPPAGDCIDYNGHIMECRS